MNDASRLASTSAERLIGGRWSFGALEKSPYRWSTSDAREPEAGRGVRVLRTCAMPAKRRRFFFGILSRTPRTDRESSSRRREVFLPFDQSGFAKTSSLTTWIPEWLQPEQENWQLATAPGRGSSLVSIVSPHLRHLIGRPLLVCWYILNSSSGRYSFISDHPSGKAVHRLRVFILVTELSDVKLIDIVGPG
jgi:hypothetical protein